MADQPSSTVRKGRTRTASTKNRARKTEPKKGVSVKGTDGEVTTIAANTPATKRTPRAKAAAARSEKQAAPTVSQPTLPFATSWFDAMTAWQKSVSGAFGGQMPAMPDPTESLRAMQKAWSAPFQAFSGAFGAQKTAMHDPTAGLKAMQEAWSAPLKAMRETWSKPAGALPTGMASDA